MYYYTCAVCVKYWWCFSSLLFFPPKTVAIQRSHEIYRRCPPDEFLFVFWLSSILSLSSTTTYSLTDIRTIFLACMSVVWRNFCFEWEVKKTEGFFPTDFLPQSSTVEKSIKKKHVKQMLVCFDILVPEILWNYVLFLGAPARTTYNQCLKQPPFIWETKIAYLHLLHL